MQRLEATEERRVGRFVAAASEIVTSEQPFPVASLAALRRLVPCDDVAHSELDRVRERVLGGVEDPVWDGVEPEVSYWEIRHEHPACHRISPGTVRRRLENVYDKLGVHTRTAAVRAASLDA